MSVTNLPSQEATTEEPPKKKGKKKLLVLLVLVLGSAAGWWFLLKPAPAESAEPAHEPGDVVAMEPVQVNLAGGHYLRVGIALQATADAAHEPDGSYALDQTITLLSGKSVSEVSQPVQREALKEELLKKLEKHYHGDVMDVYFTDFVTQ